MSYINYTTFRYAPFLFCEALDCIQSEFLEPLSVDGAAFGVFIEETTHLNSVPVLFLGQAEIRPDPLANILSHFVHSSTKDLQVVIGEERFDFAEGCIFFDSFIQVFRCTLCRAHVVVNWNVMET